MKLLFLITMVLSVMIPASAYGQTTVLNSAATRIKKILEAKRKRKVKRRYYCPRSQYYYISVLYTMINTQTIG
jgi:hypothetical protein